MNEEEKKQFQQADKKLDEIQEKARSNVKLVKKVFMKISDVDVEDAEWFKKFADKNTAGKQFLAMKVIRQVMERIDPLVENIVVENNHLNQRVSVLENKLMELVTGGAEEQQPKIPKTQGQLRRERAQRLGK